MNTKRVGNLNELQCITCLYELGCSISTPFGDADKYDLIMDTKGKLFKVQCKHANEILDEDGKISHIQLKTSWQSHNSKGYKRNKYTADEIDFFATYYKGHCYLIPIKECSFMKNLRINQAKNGQKCGINYLSDYDAEGVIARL
jgi:hypothetical protein